MILILFLIFSACSSMPSDSSKMDRGPTEKLTLIFRDGYKGLTHSKKNSDGEIEIKTWDLEQSTVRDLLIKLKFRCYVANETFKICQDRPGLCRTKCKKKLFGKDKCEVVEYIPADPVRFHLEAGTYCKKQKENLIDHVQDLE